MKIKNKTLENIGVVSLIGSAIGLLVISPITTFGFAYLGGLILNFFVGDSLVKGLNILFNTTRFTTEYIPIICGTLAIIGKYFKSTQTNNEK